MFVMGNHVLDIDVKVDIFQVPMLKDCKKATLLCGVILGETSQEL